MQMLIPEGVGDIRFDSFYRQFGRRSDYWLMMDNGMFETPPLEIDRLVKLAEMFNVQEIVVPGVWADMTQTRKTVRAFFNFWRREQRSYKPGFQAVVHGGNARYKDGQRFIHDMIDRYPEITSFGISRSFSRGLSDPLARVKLAKWLDSRRDRLKTCDVHLLGLEDSYHEELASGAQFIRSVDTVAPFTAAFHRRYLADAPTCKRPEGYFDLPKENFPIGLVTANIRYLDLLAGGHA
jgi:hypothetical protein